MNGGCARGRVTQRPRSLLETLGVTATYDGTARTATLSIEIRRGAQGVSEGGRVP